MTVLARLLTLSIRLLASGGSKLLIMLLVTTPGAFAQGHFKNYFEKKFPQDTVDIHSGMFTTYTHSDKLGNSGQTVWCRYIGNKNSTESCSSGRTSDRRIVWICE